MYLGRLLNLCELHDTELEHRLRRGWAKFSIYKKELTDKDYSLFQRLRLFHSVVTPTVLYSSGTWTMTTARVNALRCAQRKMLRAILGKGRQLVEPSNSNDESIAAEREEMGEEEQMESWAHWIQRTTREAVEAMRKTGVTDWVEEQRRRLWRWAGHVARRTDGRWSKKAVLWTPTGFRTKGHPKKRWDDVINAYFSVQFGSRNWMRYAQDRDLWHAMEKSFCEYLGAV